MRKSFVTNALKYHSAKKITSPNNVYFQYCISIEFKQTALTNEKEP